MMRPNIARAGRKGYVFTIAAFLLLSSLLLLTVFFSTDVRPVDTSAPKLAMLYDDIRGDVAEILGTSVSSSESGGATTVTFNDSLPSPWAQTMFTYKRYVESNYTKEVGIGIDDRSGSLAAADASLSLSDTALYIRPYNYAYRYNNLSKNSVSIYPLPGAAELDGYDINITITRSIVSVYTNYTNITNGNLSLRLSLYGFNYTYSSTLSLASNETSLLSFETGAGAIEVTAGNMSIGGANRTGAVSVSIDGSFSANVESSLAFNTTRPFFVDTGFSLELMDVTRRASINGSLWLWK